MTYFALAEAIYSYDRGPTLSHLVCLDNNPGESFNRNKLDSETTVRVDDGARGNDVWGRLEMTWEEEFPSMLDQIEGDPDRYIGGETEVGKGRLFLPEMHHHNIYHVRYAVETLERQIIEAVAVQCHLPDWSWDHDGESWLGTPETDWDVRVRVNMDDITDMWSATSKLYTEGEVLTIGRALEEDECEAVSSSLDALGEALYKIGDEVAEVWCE